MGQQKSNHLVHYAEITTIHGIKDLVFSRSRVLRSAWSLCLMATMGLLCWYTYDTVKYYLSGPTIMVASTAPLETYPPIHVCSQDWLDNTQASLYNFTSDEYSFLSIDFLPMFLGSVSKFRDNLAFYRLFYMDYQSTLKSIKGKLHRDNQSSVLDMMSMLSWNVSVESQGDTATIQKRLSWTDKAYFCQSISNVSQNEELEIKFPGTSITVYNAIYIVVGEDLYGEKVYVTQEVCSVLNLDIHGIQKRILLNRPGFECTHDYDSAQACLLDCGYKREVCNCNGTASTTSYINIDSSWVFDVLLEKCDKRQFNNSRSCNQKYDYCIAQCKPCVTRNYYSTLTEACTFNTLDDYNANDLNTLPSVSLRFPKVPVMEVTEQAFSYTPSLMLIYIGGLLGLFCGASVLSFVQVFLFWWGDECHIRKRKVKEAVVEDVAKQANIQSWVEQAALHISDCKLCSTVTATNAQPQKSEGTQTSQQKTNHLVNYANNTTIHGIQDFLFVKNKLLKLVWGLFLLAVASLMCEEIYRTVRNYIRAPTARTINIIDLDTYPTIHVCSDTWYNDTQARSYGFTQEDLAFIGLAFQESERLGNGDMWMKTDRNNTAFEEQKKSIQRKMEQHNLKTVRDMLNLITWNLSIQGQEFAAKAVSVVKRWRGRVIKTTNSTYVCHSVYNASAQHNLSITLPENLGLDEFIVVGEDPFAATLKYGYYYKDNYSPDSPFSWCPRQMTLRIWDINKRSLLGKDGTCNKGYNSLGVCLQDCASKRDLCSCNGTIKIASYDNNDDFFLFASRHDCRNDAGCNQNYDRCMKMCEPCTTWDYQVTTIPYDDNDVFSCRMYLDYNDFPLNITMIPRMKMSQEYYTFPVRSLLSNIGGLMGVFCGASVLSLVQLFLFWWGDGCLLSKAKGTKKNNNEDHINTWLQQAACRIPQCKLCKKLTLERSQNTQGGEVKTSQTKRNHLVNYADHTSIHGIKDMVVCKNKLIKLAWGVMLLMVFGLMCEEIYRTVKDYANYPTDIEESIILMDKYPPVHICMNYIGVLDNSQDVLKSYGFDGDEMVVIWDAFQEIWWDLNDTQTASIKRKMEVHNMRTVRDMLNIVTVNVTLDVDSMLPDDPAPQKRWRREEDDAYYVCYTFSNFTVRDGGLRFTKGDIYSFHKPFIVIGEDPFGPRYEWRTKWDSRFDVFIRESNKLSLINKGGTCSHDYTSSGVCLQDCVFKQTACNSNKTARLPSYDNDETFWLIDDPADYDNTICQYNLGECTAKCKLIPCTSWTYQSSAFPAQDRSNDNQFLKLSIVPNMIVSQEYYTYPASSLLANIGGLVSLFCGGSILSIVQVILFWWGDGCCSRKGTKRKETAIIPENNLHKWIQHAARHRT